MRHERPAQRGADGPWHYVSIGRDGSYPIGYCTAKCDHSSPERAHEHYRQYVLDHLRETTFSARVLHQCQVKGCEEYTHKGLTEPDGYEARFLCDEHRNRETYEREFYPPDGPVREAWVS